LSRHKIIFTPEDVIFINLNCGAIETADDGKELEMFFMANDNTSGKSIHKKKY